MLITEVTMKFTQLLKVVLSNFISFREKWFRRTSNKIFFWSQKSVKNKKTAPKALYLQGVRVFLLLFPLCQFNVFSIIYISFSWKYNRYYLYFQVIFSAVKNNSTILVRNFFMLKLFSFSFSALFFTCFQVYIQHIHRTSLAKCNRNICWTFWKLFQREAIPFEDQPWQIAVTYPWSLQHLWLWLYFHPGIFPIDPSWSVPGILQLSFQWRFGSPLLCHLIFLYS